MLVGVKHDAPPSISNFQVVSSTGEWQPADGRTHGRLSELAQRLIQSELCLRGCGGICRANCFLLRMALRKLETVRLTWRPHLVEEVLVSVAVEYQLAVVGRLER